MLGLPTLARALDAGLLKTVESLLRAGQFNRVANLVAASAPIAAFALKQLRDLAGDPLLVTRDGAVQLTRRAERMAAPFRELLERIGEVLSGRDVFDPAFCEETFAVAASEYAAFLLGGPLGRTLAGDAPRATMSVVPLDRASAAASLRAGTLDLALGSGFRASASLRTETLLTERFACIAAKSHPRVARRLTMSAYASERHVVVKAERALAKADPALSDPGRARRAAVAVPHFALVPAIVAESELIATLPERIAEQFAARYPIAVHRPPVRSPAFTLAMAWPARSDGDPARAWLRDLVREAAAKV